MLVLKFTPRRPRALVYWRFREVGSGCLGSDLLNSGHGWGHITAEILLPRYGGLAVDGCRAQPQVESGSVGT